MSAVNEMIDEITVSADNPANPITTIPTKVRHPNEQIWYGITPHATNQVDLVRPGQTVGQRIPAAGPTQIWGPFSLAAVLAGNAPNQLHAGAGASDVPVTVYRSG